MHDVVIVGYGPVGATAANFLGQAGLDVVVIERDPEVYARARAISTDEDALRCWQHIGLAEELKANMLADRPIDFVDSRGRSFLSFAPKSQGNGHPPQMFLYQPALEETLRNGVARFDNVTVRLGYQAGTLTQRPDHVQLQVSDLTNGGTEQVRARYLLACDGGSSPIRTQLGIGFEGRTYEDPWVVIDTKVKHEWPEVDRLRFHCDPERPAVDCPTPLGHHRWEFPVLPGEDREEISSEAYSWTLLRRYGITPDHVDILRRAVYVHHVRFATRWQQGRVFLLGDAAHCMPPWIGQGMASGVRDADNLCWKIAAVLAGGADERLLESYETERQPHVRAMTDAAVFFGRVITERRPEVAQVRNQVFRTLMHTPFAGNYLRDAKWAPFPDYRDGYSSGPGPRALVGKRLPQPMVKSLDGDICRLDDLLAGRWTTLAVDDAPGTYQLVDRAPQSSRELQDLDGVLVGLLRRHHVQSLRLRPDVFVYSLQSAETNLGERALTAAAARLSDRQLTLAFGTPLPLRAIFSQMAQAFVPEIANGFEGEIQYQLEGLGRSTRFIISIKGTRATAHRGRALAPALTVTMATADFLRVAAGEIDQLDLLKARRVTLSGDGLLGARSAAMFGRPATPDIYVAPQVVDPPAPHFFDLQEA